MSRPQQPIRVGVVGVGRGQRHAQSAGAQVGLELVALCDTWQERLVQVGRELQVANLHRL